MLRKNSARSMDARHQKQRKTDAGWMKSQLKIGEAVKGVAPTSNDINVNDVKAVQAVEVIEHEYIGSAAEPYQGMNGASGRLSGKETPVDVNGRSIGEDGAADNLSKESVSKSSKMDLFKRHNKRKSQYQPIPKEDVIFSITKKTAGLALMEIGGSDGEPYGILFERADRGRKCKACSRT